ncbi:hypothetical protein SALBM311S_02700 [Streptomyces alboniger]
MRAVRAVAAPSIVNGTVKRVPALAVLAVLSRGVKRTTDSGSRCPMPVTCTEVKVHSAVIRVLTEDSVVGRETSVVRRNARLAAGSSYETPFKGSSMVKTRVPPSAYRVLLALL